jgi:hypothetical protein
MFKIFSPLVLYVSLFSFLGNCKKADNNSNEMIKPVKSDSVQIILGWENKNFPLEMKLYEPPLQRPYEIWDTGNTKSLEEAPVSSEIPQSGIVLSPGSKKTFVLVLKNTTSSPVYFFAAPHKVNPEELSLGFKFKCLCVNHAFKVMPGEYWYRVVELIMSKKYLGDKVEITHSLIGIDEERMKEFELNSLSN